MKQDDNRTAKSLDRDPDEQIIVDRIYSAVMERRLAPRTKLNESALCESFGVGRMRVRRALLLLASQGIVDLQSNRGAYIACPGPREAQEVFDARLMLEPGIVREMAKGVTQDVIERLNGHIEREEAARLHSERTEIIRLSGEFHVELATGYGNTVLVRILRELVTRTSLIVGLFGTDRQLTCPQDEHSHIVDAIAGNDGNGAAAKMRDHLDHIRKGLNLNRTEVTQPDLVKILGGR